NSSKAIRSSSTASSVATACMTGTRCYRRYPDPSPLSCREHHADIEVDDDHRRVHRCANAKRTWRNRSWTWPDRLAAPVEGVPALWVRLKADTTRPPKGATPYTSADL